MTDTNPDATPEVVAEEAPQRPNKEARYRTERNDARAERDALAARIEALQTREVERVAAAHLSTPGDVFTLSGKALADFLTDDGKVDTDAVVAAATNVLSTRPGLKPVQRATDATQGHGNNRPVKRAPTWADLFKN